MITKKQIGKRVLYGLVPFGMLFLYMLGAWLFGQFMATSVQAQFMDNLVVIGIGCWWLLLNKQRKRHSLKEEEPFRPKVWAVFLFIVLCVCVAILLPIMGKFVTLHMQDVGSEVYQTTISEDYGLYLIMSVLIAPFAEEFLFRVFMYQSWKKAFRFPVVAMLLTSVAFAMIHGTFQHLPVAFFLGMFMSIMYEMTGQMRYCVIIHFIFNLLGIAVVPGIVWNPEGFFLSGFGVLLFMFIISVGLFGLYHYRKQICVYVTTDHLIDKWNRKEE